MHNIGNCGNIAISVFPYMCKFLLYSISITLVNAKLEITKYKRITFQGNPEKVIKVIQWSSKFQMAQLKHKNLD